MPDLLIQLHWYYGVMYYAVTVSASVPTLRGTGEADALAPWYGWRGVPAYPMACPGKWQSGKGCSCPVVWLVPIPPQWVLPGGPCLLLAARPSRLSWLSTQPGLGF